MAVSLRRPIAFALVLICALAAPAVACLWDSDTLWQERAAFPSALELITGKFLRHSPEFYAWRVQDRLEKLKADPNNLALRDDLAVAYQKTGRSAEAIAVLEEKERIQPGVYETYSNLGTVYILQGDFEKGLPYIDKALAINPDAHFGREKYQKWLVEYALSRMTDGKLTFPLREFKTYNESRYPANEGFYDFLKVKWSESGDDRGDLSGAVKGVLGMMRFADHQNPLLLEALGDLLFPGEEN
ncbi:MAG TPA: tetratricopeptide repeat protein, partial [Pirellulales bacterium]